MVNTAKARRASFVKGGREGQLSQGWVTGGTWRQAVGSQSKTLEAKWARLFAIKMIQSAHTFI